jgi:UDP-N-acetylmuramate dehydrogenase
MFPISVQSTRVSFIQDNIPLADKNWFGTGGYARFFCEPTHKQEFQQALAYARARELGVFILGEGANILISDEGFPGLIIRPRIQHIELIGEDSTTALIQAGAGVRFQDLIDWCLDHTLSGLEEFSGIPGTVGGSVFINIHYFEFLLSQFLVSATVIEKKTGHLLEVDTSWFKFGYDYSTLHHGDYYLVEACFKLKKVDAVTAAYAKGRRDEIIRHRVKRYPNSNTCGSFFRNFHEHEVSLISNGKKLIYVAYYLDKIGVKGHLSVGDAIVSYQHANMIVNKGKATSQNIIDLAKEMQKLVHTQFGIIPQPECILVGFPEWPLVKP